MSLIFYHFLQLMSFTMERMRLRVSLLFIHPFSIVHLKYRLFLARKRIPLPFFAEMLVDIYFWPLINLSLPFVRYPFVGVGNWNLFFFFFLPLLSTMPSRSYSFSLTSHFLSVFYVVLLISVYRRVFISSFLDEYVDKISVSMISPVGDGTRIKSGVLSW